MNDKNDSLQTSGREDSTRGSSVYLVGAGPGDGGLMTLRGKELLEKAEVVVYDALVSQAVLAMIPPQTRRIYVGKRAGAHSVAQEEINQILLSEAQAGHCVVRLKGGDPFVFGRGGEELELLVEHQIPFEIVPGVTSAVAVPAYAGIPLTHRDCASSLHVITGHRKQGQEKLEIPYQALATLGGTLVFLMGVAALPELCNGLLEAGMKPETPAAILENGTTAKQRKLVSTLQSLPAQAALAEIHAPAVIVVGEVCALSDRFAWAEKRPLDGIRVLVTRPRARTSLLCAKLADLGAEALALPMIETLPIPNNPALLQAFQEIKSYRWLAFTSPVGVERFFEEMAAQKLDIRSLEGISFAAIGSATAAEIQKKGILVEYVPAVYSAKELGKGLAERLSSKDKILLPRAKNASPELTAALLEKRIPYDDIAIYETKAIPYSPAEQEKIFQEKTFLEDGIDFVTFTSASTVRGFVAAMPGLCLEKIHALCIGEKTADEARNYSMQISVAEEASIESMIEKIMQRKGEK